jgi:hypothetical protein
VHQISGISPVACGSEVDADTLDSLAMVQAEWRRRLEKTTTLVLGNEIDWEERRPNKCKQKVTRAKLQMYTSISAPILLPTHVDATVAWPRWQKRGPVAFWTGGERLNEIRDPEMRF